MHMNVSVVVGVKEVLIWTIFQVTLEYTFTKLLEVSLERTVSVNVVGTRTLNCVKVEVP